MESTLADDFLKDLAGLSSSEEDEPTKKVKLTELETLEHSLLLQSPDLAQTLQALIKSDPPTAESFLDTCSDLLQKIDLE